MLLAERTSKHGIHSMVPGIILGIVTYVVILFLRWKLLEGAIFPQVILHWSDWLVCLAFSLVSTAILSFSSESKWWLRCKVLCLWLLAMTVVLLQISALIVYRVTGYELNAKLLAQIPDLAFVQTAISATSVDASVYKLLFFSIAFISFSLVLCWWVCRMTVAPNRSFSSWVVGLFLTLILVGLVEHVEAEPKAGLYSAIKSFKDMHQPVNTVKTGGSLADFDILKFENQEPEAQKISLPEEQYDVVVYVLETGHYKTIRRMLNSRGKLPRLETIVDRSIDFEQHYAPWPTSTKSIFSLISGRYPRASFRSQMRISPASSQVKSIARQFSQAGYITGGYASISARFDRMDEFFLTQGFSEFKGKDELNLPEHSDKTFGDDAVMIERYLEWRTALPEDAPSLFFLFPSNSHWPFNFDDVVVQALPQESRYEASLRYQDHVLDLLYRGLEQDGRIDRTLIVITADHGNPFELAVEENDDAMNLARFHVPMWIDHPALRKTPKVTISRPSSHADLAPTLANLIANVLPARNWQGRDMLNLPVGRSVFFLEDFDELRLMAVNQSGAFEWRPESGEAYTQAAAGYQAVNAGHPVIQQLQRFEQLQNAEYSIWQ